MKKIFFWSLGLGFLIATGCAFYLRYENRPKEFKSVRPGLFLSEQIHSRDFQQLSRLGIRTIIDMRPDGESSDQTSSGAIAKICELNDIHFIYNPIPHGDIPEAGVAVLAQAIKESEGPILMYCRSGKRAIRTFCLAEAERPDGPGIDGLLMMVKDSGFDASDLHSLISDKISARSEIP